MIKTFFTYPLYCLSGRETSASKRCDFNQIGLRVMVFNATFNNISVISWRSVLLVKETGENHQPVASHWQTLSHDVVSSTSRLSKIRPHNFSCVMDTNCIGSYKTNYHAITTTTALNQNGLAPWKGDVYIMDRIGQLWLATGHQQPVPS